MTIKNNVSGLKVSQMAKALWAPYASNHDDMTMWPQVFEQVQSDSAADSQRDWTNNLQDFLLQFGEPMTGDGTGYTITVNGAPQTLTYQSGSGTDTWTFRIAALVHNGDTMSMTYTPGNTVSQRTGVALPAFSSNTITNNLTKRVRLTLCDSTSTVANPVVVANETVKAAIDEYDADTVINPSWMLRANKASVTTDANGLFDMQYTGTASVGGTVYVSVIRAVQSMIHSATVS